MNSFLLWLAIYVKKKGEATPLSVMTRFEGSGGWLYSEEKYDKNGAKGALSIRHAKRQFFNTQISIDFLFLRIASLPLPCSK